ncbi:hypothetical protein [Agromyces marinus]|uniref:Uncharacterized protein n=1 Tax=Agromyces marinus TaxID=1389020 RepID=A0ABM8GZP1_9MICO|nr:hypothetical protein [Agromyces marinus]UIP57845.1 hypothetical protein DSM26151_07110 [Agromyces marinus]BDZ53968.1 hypothetical protein GCM10025870_10410 [Agromyces marinus]
MDGDPLNPWEDRDRLGPRGDLNPDTPDLTGTINLAGFDPPDEARAEREAEDAEQTSAGGVGDTGPEPAPEPDDLEADNEVEQDTIETVDPENPPA